MPYCRNCGAKVPEEATYCPNCGTPVAVAAAALSSPVLAGWGERFVAYLIDMIILGIIIAPLSWLITWSFWPWGSWMPMGLRWMPFFGSWVGNVIHFLYWTYMEGTYSQSVGKMIMKIKVVRSNGNRVDIASAAISSIGKAFLLPIDCIVGWIFFPAKCQRLFSYISDTVVVHA